jgi:ATP-dependent helicase HrpB
MDQPPETTLARRGRCCASLARSTKPGALTPRGKVMRDMALPPRLAAMVISSGETGHARDAAMVAVLLTEQGLGGTSIDLEDRLRRFKSERGERAEAARQLAGRLAKGMDLAKASEPSLAGRLLIHAFPDRIALQRGGRGRFVMANGRGAEIVETERLASSPMLVIADLTGRAAQARVLAAAEVTRGDVEAELPGAIRSDDQTFFDRQSKQVRARRATRLGAIVFDETPLPRPAGEAVTRALAEGVQELGLETLPFSREATQLRERIGFIFRSIGEPWPDVSDAALLARMEDWFIPYQADARGISDISASGLSNGLMALVPHELQRELARLAPTHFEAPTGQRHPIQYDGEEPTLTIRVQELFGLKQHPAIAGGRLSLLLELTSPAHRPIQTTRDLPGFWAGSWKDVRADMRGRYPRHPWPERPDEALPTTRVKPRGT